MVPGLKYFIFSEKGVCPYLNSLQQGDIFLEEVRIKRKCKRGRAENKKCALYVYCGRKYAGKEVAERHNAGKSDHENTHNPAAHCGGRINLYY